MGRRRKEDSERLSKHLQVNFTEEDYNLLFDNIENVSGLVRQLLKPILDNIKLKENK